MNFLLKTQHLLGLLLAVLICFYGLTPTAWAQPSVKMEVRLVSTAGSQGHGTALDSCDREERNALAAPGTRSDLRTFQEGNIQNMDTGSLTQRLETAKARAAELPAAALFVCLADRDLRARMSSTEKIPDVPKTTGRGASGN